jgi:hypothetical protein
VTDRREQRISEDEILDEIEGYSKFKKAFEGGKRGDELPPLPRNPRRERSDYRSLIASVSYHLLLAALAATARSVRAHWLAAFAARARIISDGLSYEPKSCGLNNAFTNLGLALLGQNNIAEAIECLDASWRVHPCPHNCSFGLDQRLATALRPYAEAEQSIEQYDRMSRRFVPTSPVDEG